MKTTKPYAISKQVVLVAYKRVKANRGAEGVDLETIADFERNLKGNLYKIWNRMSSGSYFPPAVRMVDIPKGDGKTRTLGIPTVSDRIAQMVVKMYLEPYVEPIFHEDSYGYRPNKSALDAVGKARERCWRYRWVLDVDIKGFFDNIDHELMMRAVRKHTRIKWVILYIERWLKVPAQDKDGNQVKRDKGTPQGGVISPLLANLFLHYAFDEWMRRKYIHQPFERYADDIVVHCKTELGTRHLKKALVKRLAECKLELNEAKTKTVYCKRGGRGRNEGDQKFDFLGYTFRPRLTRSKNARYFVSFNPACSHKAKKRLMEKVRVLELQKRTMTDLKDLAKLVNPILRGWINYFTRYHRSATYHTLYLVDDILVRWARRKYKRFKRAPRKAYKWLGRVAKQKPNLFAHWQMGLRPAAE